MPVHVLETSGETTSAGSVPGAGAAAVMGARVGQGINAWLRKGVGHELVQT